MLRCAGRKETIIIHMLKWKSKILILCYSFLSQGSCWVYVAFVVVSSPLSLKLLPSLISEKISLDILDEAMANHPWNSACGCVVGPAKIRG